MAALVGSGAGAALFQRQGSLGPHLDSLSTQVGNFGGQLSSLAIRLRGLAPASSLRTHPSGPGSQTDFRLCTVPGQQSCVIDGDTLRHGGETIRLADIDAPETRDPKCAAEAALGERAKHRLLELVNAAPVKPVHRGGRDMDVYGRKLRIVESQGRSVGDTLIAEGLARRWDGARRSWCGRGEAR